MTFMLWVAHETRWLALSRNHQHFKVSGFTHGNVWGKHLWIEEAGVKQDQCWETKVFRDSVQIKKRIVRDTCVEYRMKRLGVELVWGREERHGKKLSRGFQKVWTCVSYENDAMTRWEYKLDGEGRRVEGRLFLRWVDGKWKVVMYETRVFKGELHG